jgi:hypothetical protein
VDRRKHRELWNSTPRGHLLLPTSFLQNSLHMAMEARGATIDIFSFGGGRCQTCCQHHLGARHQHLQLRRWPLPEIPIAPPGGPPSTSSTSVVAASGPATSTPQGARYGRLQLQWWPLSDLPPAPPGDPPSTSPTSVVAAVRNPDSTPRGPAIDVFNSGGGRYWTCQKHPRGPAINVFNFGGGRCRTCRQHPPGGPHRRLQLQWWPLPDMSPSTTQGASHRCLGNLVLSPRKLSGGIYEGGHHGKHYHYKQGSLMEK